MSLPASLYLHEVEIFSWYHEIDPTFLILFTKDEVCHEVADEDGENNYEVYSADRIEMQANDG